jgi:hypothetical protein
MVAGIVLFESPDLTPFNFCSWVSMKSEVYIRKLIHDELLARILDVAARIKKREEQLRRTTRYLRTGVAKCIEGDGGICEHLL